jgi:hypothetical protein
MVSIVLITGGGNGGLGSIGAAGTGNAGGGGGGSGSMMSLTMPLALLPDALYLSLTGPGVPAVGSYVNIVPVLGTNGCLLMGTAGNNGAAAAAGVGGTGGLGGPAGSALSMPLGWQWSNLALAGQAGGGGGSNQTAGTAAALPVTGGRCTGEGVVVEWTRAQRLPVWRAGLREVQGYF